MLKISNKNDKMDIFSRKKSSISSIKSKETSCLSLRSNHFEDDENEEGSLSLVSQNSTKTSKIYGKLIKKGFKKIQFTITPLFNSLVQKEMLYVTGEILLDFDKRNYHFNKRSPWNDVKRISNLEADYKNEIIVVNFDQQNLQFVEFKKQMARYLKYPDQAIHQFGSTLVDYEKIYVNYQNFVKLRINEIKKSEENLLEFQQRKNQFDQLTREYYKKLNDKEKHFFCVESFPNLIDNQYIAQKMVFGRQLCNLLGTNQQSLLHILTRNGIIEFYEFETTLAINKRIIEAIVNHFKDKPVSFENFTNFQDIKDDAYYKFFSFDEIEFFARVRIEYITLDGLLNSAKEDYKYDFYSTIIFIEPSQNTINQLAGLRATQKCLSQSLIKELESDITYTIQSEYFVNQIEKLAQMPIHNSQSTIKVCGTKQIDTSSLSSSIEQS